MNAPIPLQSLLPVTNSPVRRRRASAQMTRLLVASPLVWLAGCAPQPAPVLQQDRYASKQDCVADWGEEDQCVEDKDNVRGSGNWRTPYYYGPTYWSNDRARLTRQSLEASRKLASGAPQGSGMRADGNRPRSGFGSTGRVFSSGGG
jgi:hypothetical protein